MTKFFAIVRQTIATTAAVAAIAAAGGALMASPALAADVPSTSITTSIGVSYADLDLTTPAGEAKMQTRIRAAAHKVCDYDASERDLTQIAHQNACVAQALHGAQTELAALSLRPYSGQRIAVRDAADRNVPGAAR